MTYLLQMGHQKLLHDSGISLALGGLHTLAYQVSQGVCLTVFVVLNGLLIIGDNFVHNGFEGPLVGNLAEAFGIDDLFGGFAGRRASHRTPFCRWNWR